MPAFDDLRDPHLRHQRRHPPPQQVLINQLYVVMPPHQVVAAPPPATRPSEAERARKKADREQVIDEYVNVRTELINAAWGADKHKAARDRIIDQLRGVKLVYDKNTARHHPIRDSAQNPYNNMKRRLTNASTVDAEMAEAVRLMCSDYKYTVDMAARIINAGWDPTKIYMPLADPAARKLSDNKAAQRKVKNEFDIDSEDLDAAKASVDLSLKLRGGPDGEGDPDFLLLYNRIDDIARAIDEAQATLESADASLAWDRSNTARLIEGINVSIASTDALGPMIDDMIAKAGKALDDNKDILENIRGVHNIAESMAKVNQVICDNGLAAWNEIKALATKVDSMRLTGEHDRLAQLTNTITNTQGVVTSLHADFSQKYVPGMTSLHAEVASLRQTVELQGRLLEKLTGGPITTAATDGGQQSTITAAAAPASTPAPMSTATTMSTAAAAPVSTPAPMSTPAPPPQQMQPHEVQQMQQQMQKQLQEMQQQMQMQRSSAPAGPSPNIPAMLADWTHQQGSPSPVPNGFPSTRGTPAPPSSSSVAGSPQPHHHLSAAYGGPPAPPSTHSPGVHQQQQGGPGQHQPFVFGAGGAGGGSAAGTPVPGAAQHFQHGGNFPVNNASNTWSPGPAHNNGQQYYHHQQQGQSPQQQMFPPPGAYPNGGQGGGAQYLHHPRPG